MIYIEHCANSRAVTIFIRGGKSIAYRDALLVHSAVDGNCMSFLFFYFLNVDQCCLLKMLEV